MSKRKGFTLIELLVVISVIALLLASDTFTANGKTTGQQGGMSVTPKEPVVGLAYIHF